MSREGPARPWPKPATEATTSASVPGSQPVATRARQAAASSRKVAMIFSSRCVRCARKPPPTMPTAPHSMKPVTTRAVCVSGRSYIRCRTVLAKFWMALSATVLKKKKAKHIHTAGSFR